MMNKTYKSIFPTFEEIDQNTNVDVKETLYFKKVKGQYKMYHQLVLDLIIADDKFSPLLGHIRILRNRQGKRIAFQPIVAGKVLTSRFMYDDKGWNDCIFAIKQELMTYRKLTTNIMNEEAI